MNKKVKNVIIAVVIIGLLVLSKSSYDNAMEQCMKYNDKNICERGLK